MIISPTLLFPAMIGHVASLSVEHTLIAKFKYYLERETKNADRSLFFWVFILLSYLSIDGCFCVLHVSFHHPCHVLFHFITLVFEKFRYCVQKKGEKERGRGRGRERDIEQKGM